MRGSTYVRDSNTVLKYGSGLTHNKNLAQEVECLRWDLTLSIKKMRTTLLQEKSTNKNSKLGLVMPTGKCDKLVNILQYT